MKWWQIAILAFAGLFVLGGFLNAIDGGDVPAKTDAERHQEARDSIPLPDENEVEEIEDYTAPPWEERKPVVEIYDEVELGMEEGEVWGIAGEPEMTSQAEVEGFGTMLELIYSDGHSLDNVTIMFEDGKVAMIVLGEFDGKRIDVKSKM